MVILMRARHGNIFNKGIGISKKALGTAQWKRTRLSILARDGWQCQYCGTHLDNTNAQVDHIESRVSGGSVFDQSNLVSACRRCNQSKGARSKPLFFRSGSTPPVFSGVPLPETVMTKPPSPFEKP
jgi:hypothetical protein